MTILQKLGAFIAMLLIAAASGYFTGKSHVQKAWDLEKARVEAVAKQEKERNAANLDALKEKHQKELDHAKSEAGRIAVNRWLREHGLLSSGLPVRDKDSSSEAKGSSVPNATAKECGIGGSIEGFAMNCALDASQVNDWQEWAIREGLEVE